MKKLAKYAIVFDTNVFLNLYRVSPDYADFLLICLNAIKEYIAVPKTVQIEFLKHNKALYKRRQKNIEHFIEDSITLIRNQKEKIIHSCSVLKKSKFPEIDELIRNIGEQYNMVEKMMSDYFDDHNDLTVICDTWKSDKPLDFLKQLESNRKILSAPDYETIYSICEEGQNRYNKLIPPGYKDAKDKDGLRKFCDLIWWKEVLNYAKNYKKYIILVTDDIKEDWWTRENSDFIFREELLKEFYGTSKYIDNDDKVNSQKYFPLIPFISEDFFKAAYSNDAYLKLETMTRFGSEGVEEWEIEEYEFVGFTLIGRDGDNYIYNLEYRVTMSGDSHDCWGRDEDTKEVILSNAFHHTVNGIINVEVSRTVDLLMDFNDNDYDDCVIVEGEFEETEFSEESDEDFDDGYGHGVCPKCGKSLTFETDALTGFCIKCSKESDDI